MPLTWSTASRGHWNQRSLLVNEVSVDRTLLLSHSLYCPALSVWLMKMKIYSMVSMFCWWWWLLNHNMAYVLPCRLFLKFAVQQNCVLYRKCQHIVSVVIIVFVLVFAVLTFLSAAMQHVTILLTFWYSRSPTPDLQAATSQWATCYRATEKKSVLLYWLSKYVLFWNCFPNVGFPSDFIRVVSALLDTPMSVTFGNQPCKLTSQNEQ